MAERIDSVIDQQAIEGERKYLLQVFGELEGKITSLSKTRISLEGAKDFKTLADGQRQLVGVNKEVDRLLKQVTETQARLNGGTKELYQNTKKLAEIELLQAKAAKESAAASAQKAKEMDNEAKAAKQLIKEKEDKARAEREEQKIADDLANDYLQLSKAYNDAALKAKNYALRLGENHPTTIQAVKDAKAMYDVLLRVDQAVGQSGRNVGNYKSAFQGLNMSVAQVARELPSLTISVQQFALAVSNNLPMVADEIARAKVEIAELRKQGQQVPSVFQKVMSSLVSWQVLLSVGIALLTAYAGKVVTWVKGMLDGSEAAKQARKELFELNDQQLKQNQLLEDFYNLIRRNTGTTVRGLEVQIAQARALGKSEEEILELEKQLAEQRQLLAQTSFFGEGGEAKLAELSTALQTAVDDLNDFRKTPIIDGDAVKRDSDAFKEREQQLEKSVEVARYNYQRQRAIVDEFYDANRDRALKDIELAEAIRRKREKIASDEAKALLEIFKIRKQATADDEGEQSDIIVNRINARLSARTKQFEAEKAIIGAQAKFELGELKKQAREEHLTSADTASRVLLIETKRADDIRRLREALSLDLITIRQNELARLREIEEQDKDLRDPEDEIEKLARINEAKFEQQKAAAEEARDIRLKQFSEEEEAALKKAKTEKQRDKIEEDFQRKRVKREIEANEQILKSSLELAKAQLELIAAVSVFKDDAEREEMKAKRLELEAQIAAINAALAKLGKQKLELNTDKAKKDLQDIKTTLTEVSGLIISSFDAISSIFQGNIDRQKNAIQDLIDKVEEKKNADILAVEASTLAEDKKAIEIQRINARASAEREQLERKQRQLDLQRARFDRIKNIAQIIQSTAIAVLDGLIKGGPGLAAIYGAIGAIQLAAAIATPLPRFKGGTDYSPEGWALTDEVGPEMYQEPGGKTYLGNDKPTLRYLARGTKITPAHEVARVAASVTRLPQFADSTMSDSLMRKHIEVSEQAIIEQQMTREAIKKLKIQIINRIDTDPSWALSIYNAILK